MPTFSYEVIHYVVTGCAPYIGFFERPKDVHYANADLSLKMLSIEHLRNKFITKISGGERQLVNISRALTQHTKVMTMDEPTAYLDYGNQIQELKAIRDIAQQGTSIVLTTHNPDHALLLDGKVAVLNMQGKFSFGDCKEILTESFLRLLYKVDLTLNRIQEAERIACIPLHL